jgi:hypothetical protein
VNELELNMNSLPAAARKELKNFYEYLVYKYLRNMDPKNTTHTETDTETDNNLEAFRRFKKLRDQVNPVVEKPVDIDKLINEINNDIF